MTGKKTDQQFINAAKSGFDNSVEQLDAETLSRLNTIKNIALDSGKKKHRQWILYPAGAFVTACLAVIIFSVVQPDTSTTPIKAEDIEILSASEGFDLYEDLEFYQWLEEYETST